MSFRRFLYLAANDGVGRSYSLRRIDTSRFFFHSPTEGTPAPLDSSGGAAGAADPSTVHDGGDLPDPVMNLCPTHSAEHDPGRIGFVLFNKKVVTVDNACRSFICDPDVTPSPADVVIRALPSLASPKIAPFSLTVGDDDSLYVMDAVPVPRSGRKRHTFEVLSNSIDDGQGWHWSPLDPPPPRVYGDGGRPGHGSSTRIESYAVVGGGTSIAVSSTGSRRTYRFDTASKAWSKAGNWALPFTRLAEYLPEHKLWFGVSPVEDGCRFCAADLAAVASPDSAEMGRPPSVRGSWKEYAEPPVEKEVQAVLTGVEVEDCGEEIRVVRHKSERYKLDLDVSYRPVL